MESGYRILVLGAGFSMPAGLPSGPELWQEIRKRALQIGGKDGHFRADLEKYLEFRWECDRKKLDPEEIDFEEFLGFLDTEFYLGLRGKDTLSEDGNGTQIIVKTLIGQVLLERTPDQGKLPQLYYDFAESLGPHDYILTFNYDVILERALTEVGTRFRLFQNRYSSIGDYANIVDSEREEDEVALLKLHGSLDWFSRRAFDEQEQKMAKRGFAGHAKHPVFGPNAKVTHEPIVEGPRESGDPLLTLHRVIDVDALYAPVSRQSYPAPAILFHATPWILAPSTTKIVYSEKLVDFWWGLGGAGGLNLGVVIIGYSMPLHDDYARYAIWQIVRNYQGLSFDEEIMGRRKRPVLLVDRKLDPSSKRAHRRRYRFVDRKKAIFHYHGFDDEAVQIIRGDDVLPEN